MHTKSVSTQINSSTWPACAIFMLLASYFLSSLSIYIYADENFYDT